MKRIKSVLSFSVVAVFVSLVPWESQVSSWSSQDTDFFLHGSMSTEFVPESVLRALIHAYPEIFPNTDLSNMGLIPDAKFGWPIGFSRSKPAHLAGLSSVGINCASCHVGEIYSRNHFSSVRVLGMTSHFDAEAFFNSVIGATFQTQNTSNMKRFLAEYLEESAPSSPNKTQRQEKFASAWKQQEAKIAAAIADDPAGSKGAGAGGLQTIATASLQLNEEALSHNLDLAELSSSMLKLFHNMRAALHVPDQPPEKLPPASGPGRNDAFGLLSAVLFGVPQPPSPVKYGLVWNVGNRPWVHWDGNTQSPIGRNLLASVGLGAPLIGTHAELDFALVQRQTELSESIAPPKYPFSIDHAAANRGSAIYQSNCSSCHDGKETDRRLHSIEETGTDPNRAKNFTQTQADYFNKFLANLQTAGYKASSEPGIRSTQKYWAPTLAGVWARSPYLHNGSVRTMQELLKIPAQRAASFHRGSRTFDETEMGYLDSGSYILDTKTDGNSNSGHAYGTQLTAEQKRDLIEYLKTL